jgi:chemotaxis protein CheD
MPAIKSSLPRYYLKAGELFIMEKPAMISTILGSCIALTLFNRRLGVAGICHALMPKCIKQKQKNSMDDLLDHECHKCLEAFKYADCSVFMMAEAFFRFGITPPETEVRLFGGARMMSSYNSPDVKYSVGEQNVATAKKVIAHCHLELTSSDIGGSAGRKITFNTKTGEVVQQFINQTIFKKAEKVTIVRGLPGSELRT